MRKPAKPIASLFLSLSALTMIPHAALAQDEDQAEEQAEEQESNGNTIVVDGERIDTADVRRTARDITVGSQATQFPLARWQRPFCPGIWGLGEEAGQAVLDRIVANAIGAGVEVSEEPGCGANAWVIVTDNVGETFERLLEEDSFLTRHLTSYQRRKVRAQEGDARGWNLITDRNPETGARIATGFEMAAAFADARVSGFPPPANQVSGMSRLSLGIRSDLELSVVLVERSAMADLDSTALGDYATMRLLAYVEPPSRDNPVSTVLTLFQPEIGDFAPREMTAFDMGYLRALYRSNPVRPARIAIGNISDAMEDIERP